MREKQLCHDSRAAKLAQLMANIRAMLCERGLALGCLSALPEWGQIFQNLLIPSSTTKSSTNDNNNNNSWLSLDATSQFMLNNLILLGLVQPQQQQDQQDLSKINADIPPILSPYSSSSSATNNNKGQASSSGRAPNNNNNPASSINNKRGGKNATDLFDASKSGIGASNFAPFDSNQQQQQQDSNAFAHLLPPMRQTTTRLEWIAQRILDKAERDIIRLIANHFSKPSTSNNLWRITQNSLTRRKKKLRLLLRFKLITKLQLLQIA
jgi:hypothetical protein